MTRPCCRGWRHFLVDLHDGWDLVTGEVLYFCVFQTCAPTLGPRDGSRLGCRPTSSEYSRTSRVLSRRIAPFRVVLCHNDMMPGNWIDQGERLWLIDWEYSGAGHPLFDLAHASTDRGPFPRAAAGVLEAYPLGYRTNSGGVTDFPVIALRRIALVDDSGGRIGHRFRLPAVCSRESRGFRAARAALGKMAVPARRLQKCGVRSPRTSRPTFNLRDDMTTTQAAESVRPKFDNRGQYSRTSILRYEMIFGAGYISTGGARTTEDLCARLGPSLRPGVRVLDVGSGIGGAAFHLAKTYGAKVTGIDLAEEMVAVAHERAKEYGIDDSVKFILGDVLEEKFAEPFDIIWSRDAFMHIPDKARLFSRLRELSSPGGRLVITDYAGARRQGRRNSRNTSRRPAIT